MEKEIDSICYFRYKYLLKPLVVTSTMTKIANTLIIVNTVVTHSMESVTFFDVDDDDATTT